MFFREIFQDNIEESRAREQAAIAESVALKVELEESKAASEARLKDFQVFSSYLSNVERRRKLL